MHLLIALVLQATTPAAVEPAAPQQQVQPVQPAAEAAPPETPPPEMRCRRAAPTGQRLRRRVCQTRDEIEARANLAEEATRDWQTVRGGSVLEPGMQP